MKKLAITGGTGFIGSQIVQQMQAMGYEVVLISKADINSETNMLKQKLKNASLVINLAGAPIIKDWTEPYKKYLYTSRVHTTTNLVYAIDRDSTKLFISASAVGIYGNNGPQTENNFTYADDFLGKICRDWETEALYLSDSVRTIIFRFGVVLGKWWCLAKNAAFVQAQPRRSDCGWSSGIFMGSYSGCFGCHFLCATTYGLQRHL